MKHSLDLRIISNDQATLDQVMKELPAKDDATMWAAGYDRLKRGVNENGDQVLSGMIRFNEELSRDQAQDVVMGVAGMFTLCEPGSYLRLHTCYHDEKPVKPCEVTTLYEVIEE